MNYDLLLALAFYGFLLFLFFKYRERFEVQGKIFIMYKAKWGLNFMESFAKRFPRILHWASFLSIFLGFLGMGLMFWVLLQGAIQTLLVSNATPVVSPVLPGVKIPGLPTLGFWHWIVSILIVAVIHEASHGIWARLYNIKIKSSGFAFLGPILAAFVEPDEKQLEKASKFKQLSVLSAGPFSNIITGIVFLLITLFIVAPIGSSLVESNGVILTNIDQDLPIANSGIQAGMQIMEINNEEITNVLIFQETINEYNPGDTIEVLSNNTLFNVELSELNDRTIMGVSVTPKEFILKEPYTNYPFLKPLYFWIQTLFFWLFTISVGVGLFNLLPLGPVDGGKMFYVAMKKVFKEEKKAAKAFALVSFISLALIIINLLPFIIKLFKWIFSPLLLLLL